MGNLKHTIVSMIAVVMISSLAIAQAADMTASTKANDSIQSAAVTKSIDVQPASDVWQKNLVNEDGLVKNNTESDDSTAVNQERVGYVLVTEGALNVRSAANTESEVIDQLSCAEKVIITGEEGDFYQVIYSQDSKTGYVAKASIVDSYEQAKEAALQGAMYEQGSAVVGEGALNIRSAASVDSEVIDQIDNGDVVIVIEKENEWLKVYYGREYKTGYVIAASVNLNGVISKEEVANKKNEAANRQSEKIAASAIGKGVVSIGEGAVNVRAEANESSEVVTQLSNKENVLILSRNDGWTKIAFGTNHTVGYVKSEYIKDPSVTVSRSSETKQPVNIDSKEPAKKSESNAKATTKPAAKKAVAEKTAKASNSSKGQALVNEAAKYIGVKYVYGGSSPSGFDCSGLVQYVCRKQGISVSRSSREQINNGVAVAKSDLQPGDLVFFQRGGTISHVGIYAGNGQMIHSPQTGKTVTYTSIETASRQSSYAGARRVTG